VGASELAAQGNTSTVSPAAEISLKRASPDRMMSPVMTATEINRLVDAKVAQAVAESDKRHSDEVKALVASFHQQQLRDQKTMVSQIQEAWRYEDRLRNRAVLAAYEKPPQQN
jgi:hypothetical protein